MQVRQFVLFLSWIPFICAAQDSSFTYQGRLTETDVPATGQYDFTFRLFNQSTNGIQQGPTLARTNVAVLNGLFQTDLDFGTNAFTGLPRWLEISTRHSATAEPVITLTPRQQILAAPYAVRAATFSGPIQDSQLSTNVSRLNAAQSFTGPVQFASASGTFSGNGAGLTNLSVSASGRGGFLTGRITQLPSSTSLNFASAAGASAAGVPESLVTTLSPNEPGTASNLTIKLTSAPGSGKSYTFTLRANGADTAVTCTLSGSATVTNSGAAVASIPAGADISIGVQCIGSPPGGDALFGWSFK